MTSVVDLKLILFKPWNTVLRSYQFIMSSDCKKQNVFLYTHKLLNRADFLEVTEREKQ